MKDEATFERILASLHEAALARPHAEPGFSALVDVDEALGVRGFQHVCSAMGRPTRTPGSLSSGPACAASGVRIWSACTTVPTIPWTNACRACGARPTGQLLHNTELFTGQELKTSPVYRAFQTQKCADAINVRLDGPGGSRILWFVHEPVDRRRLVVRATRLGPPPPAAHPPDRAGSGGAGPSRHAWHDAGEPARGHRPGRDPA